MALLMAQCLNQPCGISDAGAGEYGGNEESHRPVYAAAKGQFHYVHLFMALDPVVAQGLWITIALGDGPKATASRPLVALVSDGGHHPRSHVIKLVAMQGPVARVVGIEGDCHRPLRRN